MPLLLYASSHRCATSAQYVFWLALPCTTALLLLSRRSSCHQGFCVELGEAQTCKANHGGKRFAEIVCSDCSSMLSLRAIVRSIEGYIQTARFLQIESHIQCWRTKRDRESRDVPTAPVSAQRWSGRPLCVYGPNLRTALLLRMPQVVGDLHSHPRLCRSTERCGQADRQLRTDGRSTVDDSR